MANIIIINSTTIKIKKKKQLFALQFEAASFQFVSHILARPTHISYKAVKLKIAAP